MKKTLFAITLASLALTACNNSKCNSNTACQTGGDDRIEVYSGVLPAADCDGILYTLHLDYDDDHNYTSGDYDLTEAYLRSDSVAADKRVKYKNEKLAKTEGDFVVATKSVDGKEVKYIRLTPDLKESVGAPATDALYFIVDNDSTITLVGADLKPAEPSGLNYSLRLKGSR